MTTLSVDTTRSPATQPTPTIADAPASPTSRLLFVDNLRVLLTILVLLFHMMIIYAGTGSWAYTEGRQDGATAMIGAWFIASNQAFFMGLFLLISAYFVPGSYDRKGAARFLRDRLVRLGIPLVIYSWIIDPLLSYLRQTWLQGPRPLGWSDLLGHFRDGAWIGSGPLWFVETLLIFSLLYVLWRLATWGRTAGPPAAGSFPGSGSIALFAALLGIGAFLVRLWLPIGYEFRPLTLQFPFFVQYIALFVVGLLAYRRGWFLNLPDRLGRRWLAVGIALIVFFPVLAIAGGSIEPFAGGWHWQALAYALWESFVCLGMCIGLVYTFRRRLNGQGTLATFLARNAYTAYIIHGPVITIVALAARNIALYPLLKWVLASLVAIPLSFALSSLIRRVPRAGRVLG
jgi:glucans biosynthesis protein C